MNEIIKAENVQRLPLWKVCLDDMLHDGIEHGKIYNTSWFEEKLRCQQSTMEFGLGVSEIRRALESHGFYLSGRGLDGDKLVIVEAGKNQKVMARYNSHAVDSMNRGVILGANTRRELLTEAEKVKHDALLERMQIRKAMLNRTAEVKRALDKAKRKMIS
jgi:hypothetical protein